VSEPRQLRVGNHLYMLPVEVWRQINDLLGPYAEDAKPLGDDKTGEDSPGSGAGRPEAPEGPSPLGGELSDEEKP